MVGEVTGIEAGLVPTKSTTRTGIDNDPALTLYQVEDKNRNLSYPDVEFREWGVKTQEAQELQARIRQRKDGDSLWNKALSTPIEERVPKELADAEDIKIGKTKDIWQEAGELFDIPSSTTNEKIEKSLVFCTEKGKCYKEVYDSYKEIPKEKVDITY